MDTKKPSQADLDIGAALRRLRLSKNMTLTEVADLSDTDAGNLSRVERNEQHITFGRLARVCDALSLRVVELVRHVERWQEMEVEGNGRDDLTVRARKMLDLFSGVATRDQLLLLGLANSMMLSNSDVWPLESRPRLGKPGGPPPPVNKKSGKTAQGKEDREQGGNDGIQDDDVPPSPENP